MKTLFSRSTILQCLLLNMLPHIDSPNSDDDKCSGIDIVQGVSTLNTTPAPAPAPAPAPETGSKRKSYSTKDSNTCNPKVGCIIDGKKSRVTANNNQEMDKKSSNLLPMKPLDHDCRGEGGGKGNLIHPPNSGQSEGAIQLPPGCTVHQDDNRFVYYHYNGISTWTKPPQNNSDENQRLQTVNKKEPARDEGGQESSGTSPKKKRDPPSCQRCERNDGLYPDICDGAYSEIKCNFFRADGKMLNCTSCKRKSCTGGSGGKDGTKTKCEQQSLSKDLRYINEISDQQYNSCEQPKPLPLPSLLPPYKNRLKNKKVGWTFDDKNRIVRADFSLVAKTKNGKNGKIPATDLQFLLGECGFCGAVCIYK